jgi:YesN/AraC family two-component response regulator
MTHRILLADDNPLARHALRAMLVTQPWSVTTTDNGQGAMDLLCTSLFDVAVLDIFMPHHNGIEVLGQIRQQQIETDVVIMTGHGTIDLAVEAMKAGARDFLTKPIRPARMVETVDRVLQQRGPLPHVLAEALDAYVCEHAGEASLKPADLCQHFQVSERYMRRLFQDNLNASFWERRRYHRVEKAKQILVSADVLLSRVAKQCGFKNQARLSEAFRQQEGVSPKRYCEDLCR